MFDIVYMQHYSDVRNMRRLDNQEIMRITRPEDLAALVREARLEKNMTQVELAKKLEVNRVWVLRLERGEPGVSLGIVLRALNELGLQLQVAADSDTATVPQAGKSRRPPISIDEVVDE